jgi:YHS domain-containing protein
MKTTLIPLILTALFTASCKPEKSTSSMTESKTPEATTVVADAPEAIPFPKTTCLVSGEKLGEMGIPPEIVYHGRQIKFCCKSCIPKFQADPEKYMLQLN